MKGKRTKLRSGQEIWTSARGSRNMLPGKQMIRVEKRKSYRHKSRLRFLIIVLLCLTIVAALVFLAVWFMM